MLGKLGVYAKILNKALICAILFACCGLAQAQNGGLPRFEIKSFEVNGNTLLEPDQIDATLRPFTGPGKSFADIEIGRAHV